MPYILLSFMVSSAFSARDTEHVYHFWSPYLEGHLKMRGFVHIDFWKYTTPLILQIEWGAFQACLGHEAPVKWSLGSEHPCSVRNAAASLAPA